MAIEPGTYNFTLQRRSDHTIPLLFKDGNNNAINLLHKDQFCVVYVDSVPRFVNWLGTLHLDLSTPTHQKAMKIYD